MFFTYTNVETLMYFMIHVVYLGLYKCMNSDKGVSRKRLVYLVFCIVNNFIPAMYIF